MVFPFIHEVKHLTLHVICAWAELEILQKNKSTQIRSIEPNFRSIKPCRFYPINPVITRFQTTNHTLSKPKPRLYILIMVCQLIINWNSNILVPKILEPNKLPLWQSVTKHSTKIKCSKYKQPIQIKKP